MTETPTLGILMNPSSSETGKLAERPGGMKLYAWIVTTSTLLLLGLLLWPLSVDSFRSTARFQLSYRTDSGLEKATLNRQVVAALREQTSPEQLAGLISGLKSRVTSSLLRSSDAEQLQQAISIRVRLGESANSVDYQIVLEGSGSQDELEFLNTLVVKINDYLDTRLNQNNAIRVVDQLTDDFSKYHSGVVSQMATQVNDVMQRIETVRNDIQIISSDLSSYQPGTPATASRRPLGRIQESGSRDELARLVSEKRDLLARPGMTPYHWQVTALQKQIENIRNAQPQSPAGGGGFQVPDGSQGGLVKNQFASGSRSQGEQDGAVSAPLFDASLTRIMDGIRMINLQGPQRELASLGRQMEDSGENAQTLAGRLNRSAKSSLIVHSPVSLNDFQRAASSQPVGGVPTGSNFLWLVVVSGLIGGVVALNFDPALKIRRFRTIAQMQNKLGLPVIGMVRSIQTMRQPRSIKRQSAASIVKFCEWTLLGIGVLLLVAAILNSHVAAAFLENPFHGITRTVWMLTSHG